MAEQKETYTVVVWATDEDSEQRVSVFVNEQLKQKEEDVLSHWDWRTKMGVITADLSNKTRINNDQKEGARLYKILVKKQKEQGYLYNFIPYMNNCSRFIILTFVH